MRCERPCAAWRRERESRHRHLAVDPDASRHGSSRSRPARRAADRPGIDLELLSFGGTGRLSSVARDALWYPIGLARRARAADVLHCTTFRGPAGARVPTVLTVHDLAILRFPEVFPQWHRLYGKAGLARVLRGADAIVAVSEFTKAETIELAGVPAERIRVVPNGVDPCSARTGPRAEGDYVLAVATLEPRKNLSRVVEAAELAGVELRVVGARGWGGVDVPGWVGEIPDAQLAALYRARAACSTRRSTRASGSPCSRRWPAGTPVVTSREGSTAEVAGDAAILVDPRDVGSIADGIQQAASRRDELVPLGLARARGSPGSAPRTPWSSCGGAGMSVVCFDADVLGRQRTGDETYALNLLRELGPLASDAGIRLIAITRRPDLVPAGIESFELVGALAGAPHGAGRCRERSAPAGWPRPYAACPAASRALSVRRDRARPFVRTRPAADELEPDRIVFAPSSPEPSAVPRGCSRCRSERRRTSSSSTASRRRGSSSLRTASIRSSARRSAGAREPGDKYCRQVTSASGLRPHGGSCRAPQESARALEAAAAARMPLVVVGPEKDPRSPPSSATRSAARWAT